MTNPGPSAAEPETVARFHRYDDFVVGRRFDHRWGRTITADEAISFATQHVIHEPLRFNRLYARHLGYDDIVVSPMLVYAIVLGLSVEDLSESGGPFLGSDAVRFLRPSIPMKHCSRRRSSSFVGRRARSKTTVSSSGRPQAAISVASW